MNGGLHCVRRDKTIGLIHSSETNRHAAVGKFAISPTDGARAS